MLYSLAAFSWFVIALFLLIMGIILQPGQISRELPTLLYTLPCLLYAAGSLSLILSFRKAYHALQMFFDYLASTGIAITLLWTIAILPYIEDSPTKVFVPEMVDLKMIGNITSGIADYIAFGSIIILASLAPVLFKTNYIRDFGVATAFYAIAEIVKIIGETTKDFNLKQFSTVLYVLSMLALCLAGVNAMRSDKRAAGQYNRDQQVGA